MRRLIYASSYMASLLTFTFVVAICVTIGILGFLIDIVANGLLRDKHV